MPKTITPKLPKVNIRSRKMLPAYTDEELTLLAETIGLTLDQLKRYHAAANRTYQAIGSDLAQCRRDCGEKNDATREEIVECVLDANCIDAYGQLEDDLKEWRKRRFDYSLEAYYAAVAAGFPFAYYE